MKNEKFAAGDPLNRGETDGLSPENDDELAGVSGGLLYGYADVSANAQAELENAEKKGGCG